MVTLLPRYVVTNNMPQPVELCQVMAEGAAPLRLAEFEMQVLKWQDESTHRSVCVRLLPDEAKGHEDWHWQWSGAVSAETVGYSPLKVRAKRRREGGDLVAANIMIHTAMQGPVTFLTIHEQRENAALEVHNSSAFVTACFRQANVPRELEEKAAPCGASPYCWDYPHALPILQMRYEIEGEEVGRREYNMDRLGAFAPLLLVKSRTGHVYEEPRVLLVSVVARGPTKVLLIQDACPGTEDDGGLTDLASSSSFQPSSNSALTCPAPPPQPIPIVINTGVARQGGEGDVGERPQERERVGKMDTKGGVLEGEVQGGGVAAATSRVTSKCYTVNLAGVGMSIIDATPRELVYVSVLQIEAKTVLSGAWQLVEVSLGNFQVDNQTSIGAPVLIGIDTSSTRYGASSDRRTNSSATTGNEGRGVHGRGGHGNLDGGRENSLKNSEDFKSFHQQSRTASARAPTGGVREGGGGGANAGGGVGEGGGKSLSVKISKRVADLSWVCYDDVNVPLAGAFGDVG